ncbi:MAG: DUF3794 domain-containing protein [Clostridia bacterium]|nr:DUF3794 domain-containing protein [Clostridia bacterium]
MNKQIKKDIESGCDYILPDYMGDIKKILSGRARCVPNGKFLTDSGVEITGAVEYEVLYADSENRLTAINISSDYSAVVPANAELYVDTWAEARVGSFNIRITGPRKMSLKSAVEVNATVSEHSSIGIEGDAFESSNSVEKISRVINVENSLYGKTLEREFAEEGERLPNTLPEDIEIISATGSVRVYETRPVDDGVEIKGELVIVAIVRTNEQPPFAIRRAIPFEEVVEIEGITRDMQVMGDGYITSAVCSIAEEMEESVINLNVIAEFEACAYTTEAIDVVTDAYLKESETKCAYEVLEYQTSGACQIIDAVINEKVARADVACAEARDIISLNCDARASECALTASGVEISGELAISGVACEINVDNTETYIPIKITVPYHTNVNLNCQITDKSRVSCFVTPVLCEGSFDAEDMYLKCALKVKVKVDNIESVTRLSECYVGAAVTEVPTSSRITVYYPDKNDTLFGVAKRFHTTAAKLACDNPLPDEATAAIDAASSLAGVKKLIIR